MGYSPKKKLVRGPVTNDFTDVNRTFKGYADDKGNICVIFEPYPVTQTSKTYEPGEMSRLGKHIHGWTVEARLPH